MLRVSLYTSQIGVFVAVVILFMFVRKYRSGYFPKSFLIAPSVKNPPVMQETLVLFLGLEDLLEEG